MKLTFDNYHSPESNKLFFSSHQWGEWHECPARQQATIAGDYESPDKIAFDVGSMLDLAVTDPAALPVWMACNRDRLYKKSALKKLADTYDPLTTADLLKPFRDVEVYIDAILSDEFFKNYLCGDPQMILTGEIAGQPWRCMIDIVDKSRQMFTDLKTTASLNKLLWSDDYHRKVTFYEVFNYWRQVAVYQDILRQNMEGVVFVPYLAVISKQDPPAKRIIRMGTQDRLDWEIQKIREGMPAVLEMKQNGEGVWNCGECAYCRQTLPTEVVDATSEARPDEFFEPSIQRRELPPAMEAIIQKRREQRKKEIRGDDEDDKT